MLSQLLFRAPPLFLKTIRVGVKPKKFQESINIVARCYFKSSLAPIKQTSVKQISIAKTGLLLISGLGMKCYLMKPVNCELVIKSSSIKSAEHFSWKNLIPLLSSDIFSFLGAVVAALLVAYFNIQIPLCLGNIVNIMGDYLKDMNIGLMSSEMKIAALQLLTKYLGQALCTFVYISLLSGVGERLAVKLRCELFESIMRQDLEFFDQKHTGELVDCLTTDVQEFKSSFKQCISQGLRSLTQITGSVISLFIISPRMTCAMLIVVPSVIVVGTMLGSLLRSLSQRAQVQAVKAITISEEVISNIRTVRAFANEEKECLKFKEELEKASNLNISLGYGIGLFQAGTNLFLNGLVLGTLFLGGRLMITDNLSPGNLMSFLVATQTIQRSLAQLSLLFGHFIKGKQAAARVFEFIGLSPSIPLSGGGKVDFSTSIPNVEFKNVTFAYPSRPSQVILKNLNLSLPAGKTVAIVGSSGNGKSTIAALLERFYDINEGCITISGLDIRSLDPSWLRRYAIGMISQEPVLFATTIKENIRYGNPDATDKEVYDAAMLANAHDFISSFPNGYNTLLGERGVTISGGQKQRIAIARALIKNPAILILDEATSALDAESEKIVQKTLEQVCKGRTVLVIAHRLSTIQDADIIVVLNKGIIVEVGNHQSLCKKKGAYYSLMNQQNQEKPRQQA